MSGVELEVLDTRDAESFFRAFVSGRTDLPTADVRVHLDRYLALPPEEQRTYFAIRESGRVIGTARLSGTSLGFFSVVPEERRWTRDALLAAIDVMIAGGADRISANYEDLYSQDFRELGFEEAFSRMRMESPVGAAERTDVPMSHPEITDVDDVVDFLMAAYEGHVEQRFGMHVGPREEWRGYVTGIWKGDTGTYLPLASWAARDGTGLAGVSLATHWMGSPLLAEIGVRADRRGKGLGRALVVATLGALKDLAYDRLALYVTIGNDPAVRLYESLGFRQVGGRTVSASRAL